MLFFPFLKSWNDRSNCIKLSLSLLDGCCTSNRTSRGRRSPWTRGTSSSPAPSAPQRSSRRTARGRARCRARSRTERRPRGRRRPSRPGGSSSDPSGGPSGSVRLALLLPGDAKNSRHAHALLSRWYDSAAISCDKVQWKVIFLSSPFFVTLLSDPERVCTVHFTF